MKTIVVTVGDFRNEPGNIAGLVKRASASLDHITLQKDSSVVDAKSILGIFALGINKGDKIEISSEDEAAVNDLKALLHAE